MGITRKQTLESDQNQFILKKSGNVINEDIIGKILNKGDILDLKSWDFEESGEDESPEDVSVGFSCVELDLVQQKTLYEYLKKKFEKK